MIELIISAAVLASMYGLVAIGIVSNPLRLARTMGRELLAGFFTSSIFVWVCFYPALVCLV